MTVPTRYPFNICFMPQSVKAEHTMLVEELAKGLTTRIGDAL